MTFVFKNCCLCIELRTGSLTIGYLNLVMNAGQVGLMPLFIVSVVDLFHSIDVVLNVVITILDLVVIIINVAITIMLLYSIHTNKKHQQIRTFLIYNTIMLAFYVIQFVVVSIVLLPTIVDIVLNACSIILTVYFLLIIRSYWLRLKTENFTQAANQPTAPGIYQNPAQTQTEKPELC